jgi:hypothetical protein
MALFSNKPAQAEYDRLTALRGASGRWGNVRQGITSTRLDDAHMNSLTRRQTKRPPEGGLSQVSVRCEVGHI